jgi:hypothetical protein
MKASGQTGQRLVAVFMMGCLLFNYPLLALFARPVDVAGIPLLYLYVLGAWSLLIAVMAWAVAGRGG